MKKRNFFGSHTAQGQSAAAGLRLPGNNRFLDPVSQAEGGCGIAILNDAQQILMKNGYTELVRSIWPYFFVTPFGDVSGGRFCISE